MTKLINPHDKLFRSVMHDIPVARGFLTRYMSEDDKAQLDLSTLELKNSNFIDKNLSESISDLVYSCKYKNKDLGESRVIVLVEHQSKPHKLMPFRVYHYLFNILANELKDNPNLNKLPAVCALVFYHGEQSPYPYSMQLEDSFDDPANLMKNFWKKPIELIDANKFSDEQLTKQHIEGLLVLALKHGRDKEISQVLELIAHTLLSIDISDELRLQFIERAIVYLLSVGRIDNEQQFNQNINKLPNNMRGKIMTYAEQKIAEGKIEGKEEVAINLIKLGLSNTVIEESTGLSLARINELKNQHNA